MNQESERSVTLGVSSRSLAGGSPRRLWLDRGRWVLEVVRHVNIGHDLVRPTTECLSGNRLINSYFKSNPDHEPLARSASKLMQMNTGDGARSYSAVGAEWVSNSIPPGAVDGLLDPERGERAERGPNLETQIAELSMRVTALVALQEGLLVRLARLEARVLEGAGAESGGGLRRNSESGRQGWQTRARAESAEALERAAPASEPAPARLEPAARDAQPEAPVSQTPAAVAPASLTPAARSAAAPLERRARPRAEIELPPVSELGKCIALLVGNGIAVEGAEALLLSPELGCYAAVIEDESGEQLGLIVMDLRATVFLGGSLMMQPSEQLEQQFSAASPEQDSIAASAEICNALSSAINAVQTRYHVRAGELQKLNLERHAWIGSVVTRRDLSDSFGGCVSVLAMPGSIE
jgi:hypothetical protein